MKSFLQYSHNFNLTKKEPHHSYFPMTKHCVKTLVKSKRSLMKQENFPKDPLEKNWSEEIQKIHPKETVMKSFFS